MALRRSRSYLPCASRRVSGRLQHLIKANTMPPLESMHRQSLREMHALRIGMIERDGVAHRSLPGQDLRPCAGTKHKSEPHLKELLAVEQLPRALRHGHGRDARPPRVPLRLLDAPARRRRGLSPKATWRQAVK